MSRCGSVNAGRFQPLRTITAFTISCGIFFYCAVGGVRAHPLCYIDAANPVLDATATFCANEEPDGFCCNASEEAALEATLDASGATGDCAAMYQEVSSDRFTRPDRLVCSILREVVD